MKPFLAPARVMVVLTLCAAALAMAPPAVAAVRASVAVASRAHAARPDRAVPAGRNLLANPRATVGAASVRGWDAVTIPGWQVLTGLPSVVTYGTPGFPRSAGAWPAGRGRLFAGGAGGTADLVQRVPLLLPSGRPAPPGTRYRLSAWLGGSRYSWAELTARFLTSSGRVLAARTVGPVGRAGGTV